LRQAREAARLSLDEVAHALKFSPRQIELLEADQYGALPGSTIVRGFVRNYARLLKLDTDGLLRQLEAVMPSAPVEVRPPDNMGIASQPRSLRELSPLVAIALVALLAAVLLVQFWYTQTTLAGVETFARDIVDYTTNPQLSQSVPVRMLRAFAGLTISPYKGVFWYAPVLLLGLVGAVPFTRRHPWEGVAFGGLVIAHLLGYSRYNYWSGGVAWGSRYMLVVVPFLVLLAAPVWEALTRRRGGAEARRSGGKRVLVVLAWALIVVSVAIQVLGISVDLRAWEVAWLLEKAAVYGGIGQAIEALYLTPAQSPVVGHARLLLSGTQPLDFAWMQWRPEGMWAFVPAGFAVALVVVVVAAAALVWAWRAPYGTTPDQRRFRQGQLVGGLVLLIIAAACTALLVIYRTGDARYDPYDVDRFLRPMTDRLEAEGCAARGTDAACDDVLIVPDPVLTDYFLNTLGGRVPWYGLEARPVDALAAEQLTRRYGRIWLARDRSAEADDAEGRRDWERYLTDHAYKLGEERFGDWARLLRYSAAGRAAEEGAGAGAALGEFTLTGATLGVEQSEASANPVEPLDDGRVAARAGDTLQIGLRWRADRKPEANYTAFVQLLDTESQVWAQRDRWPGDGLYPTAELEAGQVITDQLALPLPVDLPAGSYRLIAGFYRGDVEGLPRLTGPDGDTVALVEVDVR
jgi:hypothetical protein